MDKLIFGLLVAVIGMLTVFFGLVILIMLIKAMTALTDKTGKKKTEAAASVSAASVVEEAPAEDEVDDGEVIAAITAAISCMMEEGSRFTVRHVRRVGSVR